MKMLGSLVLIALMAVPSLADDATTPKRAGKNAAQRGAGAAQLMRAFKDVKLTEEQTAKVKELTKKMTEQSKAIRDEAGITPAIMKKRTEAMKAMQDSDKKGKEKAAAVNKAAGLNEAQTAAMGKIEELRQKFQKEVVGLLTPEQKSLLPARLTSEAKPGQKKAGSQGKKKAASN